MTEFAPYPEWSPFIRLISGELREGATLEVRGTLADTEAGFEQMNAALKARAERASAQT